jgi:hypothetical protein
MVHTHPSCWILASLWCTLCLVTANIPSTQLTVTVNFASNRNQPRAFSSPCTRTCAQQFWMCVQTGSMPTCNPHHQPVPAWLCEKPSHFYISIACPPTTAIHHDEGVAAVHMTVASMPMGNCTQGYKACHLVH